jgi:hypothetical protein
VNRAAFIEKLTQVQQTYQRARQNSPLTSTARREFRSACQHAGKSGKQIERCHEAGHALACLVYGVAIKEVEISRKAQSAGRVKPERSLEELLKEGSEEELRNHVTMLFAGEKAEERFCAESEQFFNYLGNADILWIIDILKKLHPENDEERLRVRFELADQTPIAANNSDLCEVAGSISDKNAFSHTAGDSLRSEPHGKTKQYGQQWWSIQNTLG